MWFEDSIMREGEKERERRERGAVRMKGGFTCGDRWGNLWTHNKYLVG